MLADYFTKPLQGNVFRRFRDVIMGYKHINDLLLDPGFLLKERVEKLNNIVIKKSETNNKKGKITYADVVKTVSPKNVISESEMTMQDTGEIKVKFDGQMSPSKDSLNLKNPVCD